MDKYRKAFFASALVISLPSCLSLITFHLTGLPLLGAFIITWWGLYFYLRTASKTAFWFSFALVNLYWWPLLVQSVRRIIFVLKNGGLKEVYGHGSSLELWNHTVYEPIFLVLLTLTFICGTAVIKNIYKSRRLQEL